MDDRDISLYGPPEFQIDTHVNLFLRSRCEVTGNQSAYCTSHDDIYDAFVSWDREAEEEIGQRDYIPPARLSVVQAFRRVSNYYSEDGLTFTGLSDPKAFRGLRLR